VKTDCLGHSDFEFVSAGLFVTGDLFFGFWSQICHLAKVLRFFLPFTLRMRCVECTRTGG
jgi:hypothetical protein